MYYSNRIKQCQPAKRIKNIDAHCCIDNHDNNLHTSSYAFFIVVLKTHDCCQKSNCTIALKKFKADNASTYVHTSTVHKKAPIRLENCLKMFTNRYKCCNIIVQKFACEFITVNYDTFAPKLITLPNRTFMRNIWTLDEMILKIQQHSMNSFTILANTIRSVSIWLTV